MTESRLLNPKPEVLRFLRQVLRLGSGQAQDRLRTSSSGRSEWQVGVKTGLGAIALSVRPPYVDF